MPGEIRMHPKFKNLNSDTLKEQFIKEIQRMIISGQLKEGEQLPPERELAAIMGISRGVVNAGIVELSAKGLLKIVPRKGTFVPNFAENATIYTLELLMNYADGAINEKLFLEMVEVKRQLESRCAYLAALNRTQHDLDKMKLLLDKISGESDLSEIAALNFQFRDSIALATKNSVYALLNKSFEPVSKNIILFFYKNKGFMEQSKQLLTKIFECIESKDAQNAALYAKSIFDNAEEFLRKPSQH